MGTPPAPRKQVRFNRTSEDTLTVELSGDWLIAAGVPSVTEVEEGIEGNLPVRQLSFDATELSAWDSGILIFLKHLIQYCSNKGIPVDDQGLPDGIRRLVRLALAVPEKKDARAKSSRQPILSAIGSRSLDVLASFRGLMEFIGDVTLTFMRFIAGKTTYRRVDLVHLIRGSGAEALPIVSLISGLVGLILAFVGAIQLRMFGAQIYVADLVGIAMTREMGAMMTGIIMAGRTGAAFAAQLGTMEVNQEIDALKTLGISPMEFLIVPRMTALILMMPLLCIYADFVGMLGGFLVGVGMLDLSFMEYYNQTRNAVNMTNFSIGVTKSIVFGVLIALSGCLRGIQCGRSASAVGDAATSAVVTAIVWIIVSDAVFAVITEVLGI